MSETDPKALFQQQIPKSFLTLQSKIHEAVKTCSREKQSPIKDEEEFRVEFRELFDDDDELDEAVYYLNLQGLWFVCQSVNKSALLPLFLSGVCVWCVCM